MKTQRAKGPHFLYRLFSSSGVLLYVGVTSSIVSRLRAHARSTKWWSDVSRVSVEHFAGRGKAFLGEAAAIREEFPLHNVCHSRRPSARARRRAGWTLERIGLKYGMTKERVRQIVSRMAQEEQEA